MCSLVIGPRAPQKTHRPTFFSALLLRWGIRILIPDFAVGLTAQLNAAICTPPISGTKMDL
jgi:hypothetical protein